MQVIQQQVSIRVNWRAQRMRIHECAVGIQHTVYSKASSIFYNHHGTYPPTRHHHTRHTQAIVPPVLFAWRGGFKRDNAHLLVALTDADRVDGESGGQVMHLSITDPMRGVTEELGE